MRRAAGPSLDVFDGLTGAKARTRWEALPVARRRAFMAAMGMRVRIMPTRRGPGFDEASVVIEGELLASA